MPRERWDLANQMVVTAIAFALNTKELACPVELVVTAHDVVAVPPALQLPAVALKVPLAPVLGAVKVTVAPETGFPSASLTRAIIAEAESRFTNGVGHHEQHLFSGAAYGRDHHEAQRDASGES